MKRSPFAKFSSAVVVLPGICSLPNWQRQGADALRVIVWNMEWAFTPTQRESDPNLLKQQMGQKRGVQLWGLSEVLDAPTLTKFEQGAEAGVPADFVAVLGTTGGRDRLAVIYDSTRFDLIGKQELN